MSELSENHRHGGGRGDGNKIPAKNVTNLEGFQVRHRLAGISLAGSIAENFTDFSPRYMVITAGFSGGNSGGGQSKGTLFRGDSTPQTLGFDAVNDFYFTTTTKIIHLIDTAGNIVTAIATLGETGYTITFDDVDAPVDYLVEIYGYSMKYDRILQDNI